MKCPEDCTGHGLLDTKCPEHGFIGEYFICKTIPIAIGGDFMYK